MIEAPFPQEEYESRHQQIQRLMERDGLDLVVASARDNFWYFTGLVSYQFDHLMRPEICFIPREGKPFALVYGNNKTKAEALPWFGEVRSYVDVPFPREMLSEFLTDMGYGSAKVGFELDDDQRLGFPVNYLTQLTEALPKAKIEDGSRALTEQRLFKSPREMDNMRRACDISVRAFDRILPDLKAGVTRREVAERLYIAMIEEGAHPRHPGFLMLNASTKYDERRYEKGDRLIADFGACYESYYGDITRQAIFGATERRPDQGARTGAAPDPGVCQGDEAGNPHQRDPAGGQRRAEEERLPRGGEPQAHRTRHRNGPGRTPVHQRGRGPDRGGGHGARHRAQGAHPGRLHPPGRGRIHHGGRSRAADRRRRTALRHRMTPSRGSHARRKGP